MILPTVCAWCHPGTDCGPEVSHGICETCLAAELAKLSEKPKPTKPVMSTNRQWKPITELDRSKMQFVLVHEDGAQRLHLWNPRGYWEHPFPSAIPVVASDPCANPTHFMELPENPA